MRILVVDDRPLGARKLRDDILSAEPEYHVEVATGEGQAAARATQIVHAARERFDVFLIDDKLGAGLNGSELMAELRQFSPGSEAIIFTAYADEVGKQRAIEAGARAYISRPINEKEVLWQLRGMLKERTVRRERDWLQLLALMTEHLQRVSSTREAGDAIVEGVRRLGFQRARLRMVVGGHDEQLELIGVSQMGNIGFQDDYSTVRRLLRDLPYSRKVLVETGKPTLFHSRELGNAPWDEFIGPPKDEWFKVPLFVGQESIGTLSLDNGTDPCKYSVAERELLQQLLDQFGRQAATALERVRRHEKTEQEAETEKFVNQVSRAVTEQAAKGDLNELLNVLREQIHKHLLLDVNSFEVALLNTSRTVGRYLDFFYIFREGERQLRCWSELGDDSTPKWMVQLIEDGQARKDPKGQQLGIPLKLQDEVIGVVLVNVERVDKALYYQTCDQLTAIVTHVAGLIRTVYEAEREKIRRQRKELREKLIEKLPELARTNENHFWHAILTYVSHGECLGFNRVVLLRYDDAGHSVQGRMGIGHLHKKLWEKDMKDGDSIPFSEYLALPFFSQLHITPLATDALNWHYDLSDDQQNPFRRVYEQGKTEIIMAADLERWLPGEKFITSKKTTRCCCALVPWKDGQQVVGVVLVDNAMDGKPVRQEKLEALEDLLIQASSFLGGAREQMHLRRQSESTETILKLEQYLMAQQVEGVGLKDLLKKLCVQACKLSSAHFVVLYPLRPDGVAFDIDAIAVDGVCDEKYLKENTPRPEGVTAYVLRNGTLSVSDTKRSELRFSGDLLGNQNYIVRERIDAFIGTPINMPNIIRPLGVLYFDWREKREFSQSDIELAERFARVAQTVIAAAYRVEQEVEELTLRELASLQAIQEESLTSDTTETRVIPVILKHGQELLNNRGKLILMLREWDTNEELETVEEQFWYYQGSSITGYEIVSPSNTVKQLMVKAFEKGTKVSENDSLAVAIKTKYRTMGSICVIDYKDNDLGRIFRLTEATAIALDNIRRQNRLQAVLHAAKQVVAPTELAPTLKHVIESARKASKGMDCVTLWYRDPISKRHMFGEQWGVTPKPLGSAHFRTGDDQEQQPLIEYVMTLAEPLWVEDVQDKKTPELLRLSSFVEKHRIVSIAAFPLWAHGECVGALFFNYRRKHKFSHGEQDALAIFAEIAATSIHDAQSLEKAQQGERRLDVALEVVDAVGTELDWDAVLRKVLNALKQHFDKIGTKVQPYMMLYDKAEEVLYLPLVARAFDPVDSPQYMNQLRLDLDGQSKGIVCRVARLSREKDDIFVEKIPDAPNDPDFLLFNSKTQSLLCAGLTRKTRLWGVLAVSSPKPDAFSDQDKQLLELAARQALIAMERAEQAAELRFREAASSTSTWAAELIHDINKDVNSVRTRTDLLRRKEKGLSEQGRLWVEEIDGVAARLAQAARSARDDQDAPMRFFDLDDMLREKVQDLMARRWPGVIVQIDSNSGHTIIYSYPERLWRAVRHLIRNAGEAMKDNGMLKIHVRYSAKGVDIEIIDTGDGIPLEKRNELLTVRYTSSGDPERGYGLLIARSLLKSIDGDIKLLPQRDEPGAVFLISLPHTSVALPAAVESDELP